MVCRWVGRWERVDRWVSGWVGGSGWEWVGAALRQIDAGTDNKQVDQPELSTRVRVVERPPHGISPVRFR